MSNKVIVYCSDGNDIDRLKKSIYSVRLHLGNHISIYVLTDNEKFPRINGVKIINPKPYLEEIGFNSRGWNRYWPFSCLYRLVIPLIEEFQNLERILYLDTDVLVRSSKADWLFSMKIGDYEVLATPDDRGEIQLRIEEVIENDLCIDAKSSMLTKLWLPRDTNTRSYVNAGVAIWCVSNIVKNGIDWYKQRLKWFWEAECRGKFYFLDQDFINVMMDTCPTLSPKFNFFGGDHNSRCIIQHFVAKTKSSMW